MAPIGLQLAAIDPAGGCTVAIRHQFLGRDPLPIPIAIDDIVVRANMTIRGRLSPARTLSAFDRVPPQGPARSQTSKIEASETVAESMCPKITFLLTVRLPA
jgi:hypothetical protein